MAVAGNSGACCECSQLTGCDCETLIPSTLSCENKAGSAILCGYPEWDSPSDPPKYYRRCTAAGGTSWKSGCQAGCSDCAYIINESLSGEGLYNKLTCETTNDMILTSSLNGGESSVIGITPSYPVIESYGIGTVNIDNILSSTVVQSAIGSPACRDNTIGWAEILSTTGTKTLSDEDTDADAEARAAAAISTWTPCGDGCSSDCSAFRTDRTGTGEAIFGFRIVHTKVHWTAAIGNNSYKVTTRFYRRLLGSTGPYLLLSLDERTINYFGLLVPTPAETPWIDVPNEAGWETIAGGQTVELLP